MAPFDLARPGRRRRPAIGPAVASESSRGNPVSPKSKTLPSLTLYFAGALMFLLCVARVRGDTFPEHNPTPGASVNSPDGEGALRAVDDTPSRYEARGRFFVKAPHDKNAPFGPMRSPLYAIPPIPCENDPPLTAPRGGPPCWTFSVWAESRSWQPGQTNGTRLGLRGNHWIPPHNEGPNKLPPVFTNAANIPCYRDGKGNECRRPTDSPANITGWGWVEHPDADPPTFKHYDVYGIVGNGMTYKNELGTPAYARTLDGTVEVTARHQGTNAGLLSSRQVGTSAVSRGRGPNPLGLGDPPASAVRFDADTGTLSFRAGTIDVLDQQGGLSGGIDPRYAGDPVLGATLQISDITLEGQDEIGRFLFSGGTVSLTDPNGEFGLTAEFPGYAIGDTSKSVLLDSFGLLFDGGTFDSLETHSLWLQDFVDDHVSQQGGLRGPEDEFRFIDLAFITDTNLADLTGGFTQSTGWVPADIYLGGNGIPEPATALLCVLAVAAGRARRRPSG